MKGSSRRPEQVSETLRQVIAEALTRGIRDPRVGFVTVTRVEVSPDLSHAKVYVAAPGEEADRERTLEGLLNFELDRGLEHATRINQLLEDLRRESQG